MAVDRSLFVQAVTDYTAEEFRRFVDAAFPNPGVLPGSMVVAPTETVSMAVTVGDGYALIPSKGGNTKYLAHVSGTETKPVSPASSQNRIDLLVLQVNDTAFGDSNDTSEIALIEGAPSDVPVAPDQPGGSQLLARISVRAGVTQITAADITDMRSFSTVGYAPQFVRVTRSGALSVPNTTWVSPTSWSNGVTARVGDQIDLSGGALVVRQAGMYAWWFTGLWSTVSGAAVNSARSACIKVNEGTSIHGQTNYYYQAATVRLSFSGSTPLAAGDRITPCVYHNGGAGKTGNCTPESFSLSRVA